MLTNGHMFPSPYGDLLFLMIIKLINYEEYKNSFRPLTGICCF